MVFYFFVRENGMIIICLVTIWELKDIFLTGIELNFLKYHSFKNHFLKNTILFCIKKKKKVFFWKNAIIFLKKIVISYSFTRIIIPYFEGNNDKETK